MLQEAAEANRIAEAQLAHDRAHAERQEAILDAVLASLQKPLVSIEISGDVTVSDDGREG